MDIITYALCKKLASGAVSGVTSMSVSGQTLTINCTDGTVLTMDFPTPADGISITGVAVNASKHLIVTLSDSSTIDAGEVPTVQGDTGLGIKGVAINNSNHLIVTYDDDTTEDAGEIEGIHTSFSDITDIAVSELADGQILKYDATSGKWKNVSPGSVDTDLGDLNDVDLTNIQDGQMIAWDAQNSKWVNVTPSADIESLNDIDDVNITSATDGQILKFNGTSEKWENATIDATPTENSANVVQSGGVFTALGNKVDKVSGKGLSTEDYTSEEKTKLSGIETGAEANVQSDWNQSNNEADDFIKNKPTLGTASAKDSTDTVRPNSHDLIESNAVANAINQALTSVYTPRGDLSCAELTSALLIAENVGNVYEMSDTGETSALFIQGAGIPIAKGNNVGIIKANADTYMFNYMGNSFDLHDYQKKDLASSIEGASTVEGALGALSTNKLPVGSITNPNLLDNPWFTVNQRGLSSYTSDWVYTVDRWLKGESYTLSVGNNGISASVINIDHGHLSQRLDIYDNLVGKTCTLSILKSTGEISSATGVVLSGTGTSMAISDDDIWCSLVRDANFDFIALNFKNTTTTVRAVKLELGSVSTLAMDTAPNYATELLKCQRYFYRLAPSATDKYGIIAMGIILNQTTIRASIPLFVQMRTKPTVVFNLDTDKIKFGIGNASSLLPITNMVIDNALPNPNINFICASQTTFSGGQPVHIWFADTTSAYIDLSADL